MNKYWVFAPRLAPQSENFCPGHRACIGCAEALALRLVMKAAGPDVIVACATGCMEIVSSPLPTTNWRVPWIHTLFENTAAVASGIEAALKVLDRKGRGIDRPVHVIGMGGDGATGDIGIQALSGALERGHDMLYVCFDNEAYMNTGIQRSGSTPYGAMTTTSPPGKKSIGQRTQKKNLIEIVAAHDIPYVATACPSYPIDLMQKVQRGLRAEGPAYLHILSVCPTGWRSKPELAIAHGRLAVQTGVFPLYEIIGGKYVSSLEIPLKELRPVRDYIKGQGRFRHLKDADLDAIQQHTTGRYKKLLNKFKQDRK
jgi:pyruvate ferredoxin oxidoreductase beta subunit